MKEKKQVYRSSSTDRCVKFVFGFAACVLCCLFNLSRTAVAVVCSVLAFSPQVEVVAPKCWSGAEDKSCFMYMFRSKRTNNTKKLVKAARKRRGDESRRAAAEDDLQALLKQLKDNQLEMLATAVEGRGRDQSNCVLLPRDFEPHVLFCRTWRWPDLRTSSELRRLPSCRSALDPIYICCNPYHWSRLCIPGK